MLGHNYVLMMPHGHDESHGKRCRFAVGILGTFVAFLLVGFGVYICVEKEEEINELFAFGTALILIVIKNILPFVVKYLVEFEQWTDVGDRSTQILVRVYFLKMAQLVVLLMSFENIHHNTDGTGNQLCQSTTSGVTMYKLVITNGVFAMLFKPAFFLAQRCVSGSNPIYDYDTVMQVCTHIHRIIRSMFVEY